MGCLLTFLIGIVCRTKILNFDIVNYIYFLSLIFLTPILYKERLILCALHSPTGQSLVWTSGHYVHAKIILLTVDNSLGVMATSVYQLACS